MNEGTESEIRVEITNTITEEVQSLRNGLLTLAESETSFRRTNFPHHK